MSTATPPMPRRTLQAPKFFAGRGTALALAAGVFLAGCVGAVDPRIAATDKTNSPSAVPASGRNLAPAVNAPKDWHSAPLSPIESAETSTRQLIATLSTPVDIWDRIRRGFALPDLEGELVREKEQWYASRPDYIQRMTDRSNRYMFHIVEEVERRGLPSELALLPYIESAFNPQAVSSARAAGMWQFMPATGESFDLKQNMFRDDRRDVLASTNAALDYLEQLHARFGDWHLALAAYNWGQGNINRAITRNKKAGLPTDYNSLDMPAETRQYVPKLQAVKNIVAAPEAFATQLPDIGNHPFFDAISISQDIDVALIIRLAEIKESDFQALNPSLKQPVVMAAGTPQILLPWDNANAFEVRLAEHTGPLSSWTAWVVPSTLSASEAAKRVGMSEEELRQVNNIPPRMLVRSGSSLLVRRSEQRNSDVSEYVADNARLSLQPESSSRRTTVRVRKGDTLSGLAQRYGVSVASIASMNKNISSKSKLRIGQTLALTLTSNQGSAVVVTRSSKQTKATTRSKSSSSKSKAKSTSAKRSTSKSSSKSKSSSGSSKSTPTSTSAKKKKKVS